MFGNYVDFLQSNMDLSALKKNTISMNISNYNTTNYKAQRVDEGTLFSETLDGVLKSTNTKHITSSTSEKQPTVYEDTETVEREDGNNVDLTGEMMEMIKTQGDYSKTVQAFNYEIGLIKSAIGK